MVVLRRVGAGFPRASSVQTKLTKRTHVSRKTISDMGGASPGPATAALYITERARTRTVTPGASAKNSSGGTGHKTNGRAATSPISRSENLRIIARQDRRKD